MIWNISDSILPNGRLYWQIKLLQLLYDYFNSWKRCMKYAGVNQLSSRPRVFSKLETSALISVGGSMWNDCQWNTIKPLSSYPWVLVLHCKYLSCQFWRKKITCLCVFRDPVFRYSTGCRRLVVRALASLRGEGGVRFSIPALCQTYEVWI